MDPCLPPEIVEHIISSVSGDSQQTKSDSSTIKHTLLVCALVCKAWAPVARYHFQRLCYPTGIIKISPTPHEIHYLANIFGSPFCTLDPGFIKTLRLTGLGPEEKPKSFEPEHFFAALSTLDTIPLPSLHTVSFNAIDLGVRDGSDNYISSSPPPAVLSQIKFLELGPSFVFFETMIPIIRVFPALKAVTARGCYIRITNAYPLLPPPKSLRKLDLDMPTFLEMAEWLTRSESRYTYITSLSICNFCWGIKFPYLWKFLDMLGQSLEEFELRFDREYYDYGGPQRTKAKHAILGLHAPSDRFAKNTSLKRFVLGGPLDIVTERLAYFFQQTHFAPRLETLEIVIQSWINNDIPLLFGFSTLDKYIRARPSMSQVIVSYEEMRLKGCWADVKSGVRYYMPYCKDKGILAFK